MKLKDEVLNELAEEGVNIAQFVSFDNYNFSEIRYCCMKDNIQPNDSTEAIKMIINNSNDGMVNVRAFNETGKSLEFRYGLRSYEEVVAAVDNNIENGFYSIVNETIDVNDGGVSGVTLGETIEFAPNSTPRCVEEDGVCTLPNKVGVKMLETVYGFKLDIPFSNDKRVEFSIHPHKQGLYSKHTIIWEVSDVDEVGMATAIHSSPNMFSDLLGEKTYGLVLAHSLGEKIPKSLVLPRRVAPFTFGEETTSTEVWMRTAPNIKQGGLYATRKGWIDPYLFMQREEEKSGFKGSAIGSLIVQDAVESDYSGAAIIYANGSKPIIEGSSGVGDGFMIGEVENSLPNEVFERVLLYVRNLQASYSKLLKNFSIEWAIEDGVIWLLQLNQMSVVGYKDIIVPTDEEVEYMEFHATDGIATLRTLIEQVKQEENIGIEVVGNIGITSHIGDILRADNIPSKRKRIE